MVQRRDRASHRTKAHDTRLVWSYRRLPDGWRPARPWRKGQEEGRKKSEHEPEALDGDGRPRADLHLCWTIFDPLVNLIQCNVGLVHRVGQLSTAPHGMPGE
eukprot:scaffold625_cov324-Pavlova_lutheri.AAC.139